MSWKWLRSALAQWQANLRLRYSVLLIIVIVSVHGILKIADQRDTMVKDWGKNQDLLIRLKEVSVEPRWPQRAITAESKLHDAIMGLPLVHGRSQARAELHMWLIEQARKTQAQNYQVSIEDALDVPGSPGLMQVVGKLEMSNASWELASVVRQLARGLPWRQVQRMELNTGEQGRMTAIVRSYYRDASIKVPLVGTPEGAIPPSQKGGASKSISTGSRSATSTSTDNQPARAPFATSAGRERDLPKPQAAPTPANRDKKGIVQAVLQPDDRAADKPAKTEHR